MDETGRIAEGTITNVGFWRDGMVIWPDAPKLAGITMLLLRRQLAAAGIGQAEEQVRVQDLASYDGMILSNSRGWAPVSRVDDLVVPQDEAFTGVITAAIESCLWDEIYRPARPTATCARPSTASTSNQVRTNVSQAKCDELLLDAPRRFATGRNLVGVCYLGVDHLGRAWRGADAPPEGLVLPARAPSGRFSHRRPPAGTGLGRSSVSRLTRSPARREARIPLQAGLAARRSARRAARRSAGRGSSWTGGRPGYW